MSHKCKLAGLFILVLLFTAIQSQSAAAATYLFAGSVADRNGNPVAGAEVEIFTSWDFTPVTLDPPLLTDAYGQFEVTLTGREYRMVVTPPEGSGLHKSALVWANIEDPLEFVLYPPGPVDHSFGTNGFSYAEDVRGPDTQGIADIIIQEDGKILLGGHHYFWNSAMARFNPDGTPDTTFGDDGFLTPNYYGDEEGNNPDGIHDLVPLPDNKFYALVSAEAPVSWRTLMIARYDASGQLDPTFNGTGWVEHYTWIDNMECDTTEQFLDVRFLLSLLDGDKFLITCSSSNFTGFMQARLHPDGSLDTSFADGGFQYTDFSDVSREGSATTWDSAAQADGKTVVLGSGVNPYPWPEEQRIILLARYDTNGDLDPTFGTDGRAYLNLGQGGTVSRLAVDGQDHILVTGGISDPWDGSYDRFVARFTADGIPDTSFAEDGVSIIDFDLGTGYKPTFAERGTSIAIQEDGKVLTIGSGYDNTYALARLDQQGQLDGSYGEGGLLIFNTDYEDLAPIEFYGNVLMAIDAEGDVILSQGGRFLAEGYNGIFGVVGLEGEEPNEPPTPAEAIENLIALVQSLNLQQGIDNGLDAKLDTARKALDDVNQNNDVAAINALEAFVNAVEAQRGKSLSDAQADHLAGAAQAIIDSLVGS